MIAPGSKGWINKFFSDFTTDELRNEVGAPEDISEDEYLHLRLLESGIVFGFPSGRIFQNDINTASWTQQEKLKFLLFESLLFVYLAEHKDEAPTPDSFKASLLNFYKNHNSSSITDIFNLFLKESEDDRLEKILSQRIDVKGKIVDSHYWFNYLSNTFVFLDVILYQSFIREKTLSNEEAELSLNALMVIAFTAFSNGKADENERKLFDHFLASANLSDKQRKFAEDHFQGEIELSHLMYPKTLSSIYKRFLMDISALTIFANQTTMPDELLSFNELCQFLEIPNKEVENSVALVENFVLIHNNEIDFLKSSKSYEQVFGSLSKRWMKILARNKDKLAIEIKESKELVYLVRKSTKEDLTEEEKALVKNQFKDIIKSMPALAIFMLPGGALLLPIVLKILPDLIPSAFRSNEIEEEFFYSFFYSAKKSLYIFAIALRKQGTKIPP